MAGKGGARPGAGRKPQGIKRVMYSSPIQIIEAKISEKLPWLVDKMFELAEGVDIEREDRQGQKRIYSEKPDRQAIAYLMDRVLGKAVERQEHGDAGTFDRLSEDDAIRVLSASRKVG